MTLDELKQYCNTDDITDIDEIDTIVENLLNLKLIDLLKHFSEDAKEDYRINLSDLFKPNNTARDTVEELDPAYIEDVTLGEYICLLEDSIVYVEKNKNTLLEPNEYYRLGWFLHLCDILLMGEKTVYEVRKFFTIQANSYMSYLQRNNCHNRYFRTMAYHTYASYAKKIHFQIEKNMTMKDLLSRLLLSSRSEWFLSMNINTFSAKVLNCQRSCKWLVCDAFMFTKPELMDVEAIRDKYALSRAKSSTKSKQKTSEAEQEASQDEYEFVDDFGEPIIFVNYDIDDEIAMDTEDFVLDDSYYYDEICDEDEDNNDE